MRCCLDGKQLDALKKIEMKALNLLPHLLVLVRALGVIRKKNRNETESFCIKLHDKDVLDFQSTLKKLKLEKLDHALLLWFNREHSKG